MPFSYSLLSVLPFIIAYANTEHGILPSSMGSNYPMFREAGWDQFLHLNTELTVNKKSWGLQTKKKNEKVKIQVFYESFCYGSRRAIVEYLIPAIEKLGDHLEVRLYPYGLAKTFKSAAGIYEIQCQHGPLECYGNMLHACALDLMKNYTAAIFFNACMMSFDQNNMGSDDEAVDKCGNIIGVRTKLIKFCARSQKGLDLHKHYGEFRKTIEYKVVPHVLINGVQYKFTSHVNDFIKAIRETFENL